MVPSSEGFRGDLQGVQSSHSQPLCHPLQCQASSVCASSSGPDGVKAGCIPAPLGPCCQPMPSLHLLCSGRCCREFCFRPGSHWFLWPREGVVCQPSVLAGWRTTRTFAGVELAGTAPRVEVPSRPRDHLASRMEVIQCLVWKSGFSKEVEWVNYGPQVSTAALYQPKWSRFLGWYDWQGIDPCKESVLEVAEFFLFLCQNLSLSVLVVKGYQATLNHVFSLSGMDLATSSVVSHMFRSFERSCAPQEIRPPERNLSNDGLAQEKGVPEHYFFLAALCDHLRSCFCFGGGFLVFEGQGSRSQEGCKSLLFKGVGVGFGDGFCRTVWGVCLSLILYGFFFFFFFYLAAKLIGWFFQHLPP